MMIAIDPVDENYLHYHKYFFKMSKARWSDLSFLKETIYILKKSQMSKKLIDSTVFL